MARKAKDDLQKSAAHWRGTSATYQQPEHAWQQSRAVSGVRSTSRRALWRRLGVAVCLLCAVLSGAGFLAILQQREVQPPFVTIVKTDYQDPFTPNAWAQEDLRALRDGDDRLHGRTIGVVDFSEADRRSDSLFPAAVDRQSLRSQARDRGVIIFYVSMHGVVDDSGRACVAFPESNALDSTTWLPVADVLKRIRDLGLPDSVHKLLIFDANRELANWGAGIVENTFASRLEQALAETPVPNLVILNSTSPGETGWSSPELRGTAFGQFLRLGLAGAADLTKEGGNHDSRVSLKELHHYLLRHVDSWVRMNRGTRQQPMLIPSTPDDFVLTCSVNQSLLEKMVSRFATDAGADSSLPTDRLNELWRIYSDLDQRHADSLAPHQMSVLRRTLVRLERSARAGAAYRRETAAAEHEWVRHADQLRERAGKSVPGESIPLESRAAYADAWVPGLAAKLRSLPLLTRLGRLDPATEAQLLSDVKRFQSQDSLDELAASPTLNSSLDLSRSLTVVHFIRLLKKSLSGPVTPSAGIGLIGPASEMQTLSDLAAVPRDPRSQKWIHGAVEAADLARRRAQDNLLAGVSDPALEAEVREAYGQATEIDTAVAEALLLTDELTAELPDLAGWLLTVCERNPSEAPALRELLATVIAGVQSLIRQLEEFPVEKPPVTSSELPFLSQFQELRLQYRQLRQQFDDACERLATRNDVDPLVAREVADLLDWPLLSSRSTESGLTPLQQRQAIQSRYAQLSRDLHRRSLEQLFRHDNSSGTTTPEDASPDVGADSPTIPQAPRVGHRHPLVALLEPLSQTDAAKTPDSAESAAKPVPTAGEPSTLIGASVRRILRGIPARIDAARERHLASLNEPSQAWRQAARQSRIAAPWIALHGPRDPESELRRVDVQQLLLWHARRYTDDFWGPAIRGEHGYFDSAASAAIDAARLIGIPNPAASRQINELETLLGARRDAARRGLVVRANPVLMVDPGDRPTARVGVIHSSAAAGSGFPPGTSTLRIADAQQNLLAPLTPVLIRPVSDGAHTGAAPSEPKSLPPEEFHIPLSGGQRDLADTIGTAMVVFRGHEFRDDLVIKTAAGTTVEIRPQKLRTARIRLNGNQRQRPAVVFILDCSASMRQLMPFESRDSQVSRMEVAKAALVRMLDSLAARGDARVGVILYGHRIGWSTKEPNQLLTQPASGAPLPEGLMPYEDIETILPLGRFDPTTAARVAQRLEKIRPWGETPLYLALTQALQEFKDEEADVQRSVVVITDGMNYQFNPSPEKARTAQDVLAADGARRIPLHIVGFGIQPDERDQAQRVFGRLSAETGGHYVSVAEATSLAETLEDILQRQQYSVRANAGARMQTAIGSSIELQWNDDAPQEFVVSTDQLSESVEVTGGEALELFVNPNATRLLSAGYEIGAPTFSPLVGGSRQDPTGVRLGVHQPVREDHTVIFDFSLQQAQQRWIRRPREVWIEVTPLHADNRLGAKYIVYDPEFVPHLPVPVLRVTARNWPQGARRARIDFWCRWSATEPSLVIPLSEVPGPELPLPVPAAVDAIPGLKFQVRQTNGQPARIDFIETYSADRTGGTLIRVELTGPVLPSRTLHQFDDANHFATHSFLFDNEPAGRLSLTNSLRVISRRRMLDEAQYLELPMTIEVPDLADTVPNLPAAN
jgi:Mg-chelatase subunit ChlD